MTTETRVVRVFLKSGRAFFDTVIGEDFNLAPFWMTIKAQGEFRSEQVCVPYENIEFVAIQKIPSEVLQTLDAQEEAKGATRN